MGIYQVILYGLQVVGIGLVLLVLLRLLGDLRLVVIGCVAGVASYVFAGMPFIDERTVFLGEIIDPVWMDQNQNSFGLESENRWLKTNLSFCRCKQVVSLDIAL